MRQRARHSRPTSCRIVALVGCLLLVATVAAGQGTTPGAPPSSRGEIDNTRHPEGTVLAPPGQLGHVERRGRGPVPLILIPGAGFGWRTWEAFMARNAERYTMYAITPAGFDATAPWPQPEARRADGTPDYRHRAWADAFVAAIADLVRRERIVRPVIVGHHTLGDYLSLRVALSAAVDARALVVVAGSPPAIPLPTHADPRRPGARDSLARDVYVHESRAPFFRHITLEAWRRGTFTPSALSISEDVGSRLAREQSRVPLATQIRYFLEYLSSDLSSEYARLTMPVLLIPVPVPFERASEQFRRTLIEQTGSDSAARRVYGVIARWPVAHPSSARTLVIENTGIFVMLDRPDAFDAAILEFVRSLP